MSEQSFGFRQLISPVDPLEFVERFWARQTLYVPGHPEKFERWFNLELFRQCVQATSNTVVDEPVFEKMPEAMIGTIPFVNLRSINVFASQFELLSRLNMNFIVPADKLVVEYATTLKRELSYPGQIRAQWWSSPRSGGYPAHLDDWGVLVFQVEGTKQWRVQKTPSLEWPLASAGSINAQGKPDYLGPRNDWELDDARPCTEDELMTITLRPGDVLYMPAGAVHSTQTLDERAIALHFNFFPVRMSDVVHRLLGDVMMRDVHWRTAPICYTGPGARAADAATVRQQLGERLAELRRALESPTVTEEAFRAWQKLIAKHDASGDSYVRYRPKREETLAPQDRLRFSRRHPYTYSKLGSAQGSVLALYVADHEIEFDTPEEVALAEDLLAHADGFCAGEVRGLPWDEARPILEHLVELDVLERVRHSGGR